MGRIASWRLASFAVLVSLAAPAAGAAITAGGTGTAAPLMRALAAEYARVVPDFELRLIDPPLGSGGALKALAGGRIDFALIGRAPKGDEAAAVGESFELARTPFVLASSDGVRPAGFTLEDLHRVRRFGCAECYTAFREDIAPMLRGLHRGASHVGKVPEGLMALQFKHQRMQDLRSRLEQAIASENYEEAAGIRDEIRNLGEVNV